MVETTLASAFTMFSTTFVFFGFLGKTKWDSAAKYKARKPWIGSIKLRLDDTWKSIHMAIYIHSKRKLARKEQIDLKASTISQQATIISWVSQKNQMHSHIA